MALSASQRNDLLLMPTILKAHTMQMAISNGLVTGMKVLLACYLCLCPAIFAQANIPETVKESHGTVNIFFANQNGLVAVVDSMLTSTDPRTKIVQHDPNATKLFKVDDFTICSMAGFYSFPGALDINEFAATFPVIMSSYVRAEQSAMKAKSLSFSAKLEFLERVFEFDLTNNLSAYLAFNPTFHVATLQPIVLTLAGYDRDGTLKLAEFALTPTRTADGVSLEVSAVPVAKTAPSCETTGELEQNASQANPLPPSRVIGKSLSCEIAGLPNVAEQRLAHAEMYPGLPALHSYALSLKKGKKGKALSIKQMRDLALELEKETATDEQKNGTNYVGGDAKVAVLSKGQITEQPPTATLDTPLGSALPVSRFDGFEMDCGVPRPEGQAMVFGSSRSLVQARVKLTNCGQQLDGVLFHDSQFIGGILTYYGSGPLLFAHNNIIDGSTLILGPFLKLNDPLIKDFVCYFPWKSVERYGSPGPIAKPCG